MLLIVLCNRLNSGRSLNYKGNTWFIEVFKLVLVQLELDFRSNIADQIFQIIAAEILKFSARFCRATQTFGRSTGRDGMATLQLVPAKTIGAYWPFDL